MVVVVDITDREGKGLQQLITSFNPAYHLHANPQGMEEGNSKPV